MNRREEAIKTFDEKLKNSSYSKDEVEIMRIGLIAGFDAYAESKDKEMADLEAEIQAQGVTMKETMNLKEIKDWWESPDAETLPNKVEWLISRVETLEEALKAIYENPGKGGELRGIARTALKGEDS